MIAPMRGQSKLDSFSTILAGLAHRLGLETKLFEARLRRQWPDIVGEPIAIHTRPDQIRFKKLTILVHNSVWLQQLTFFKPVLLEKLHAMGGKPLVTEIVLRIGKVALETVATPSAGLPDATLQQPTAELLTEATQHTQGIQDQVLRNHLTAVMVQTLSRPAVPSHRPRQTP